MFAEQERLLESSAISWISKKIDETFLNLSKSISDYKIECFFSLRFSRFFFWLEYVVWYGTMVAGEKRGSSKNKYFEFVVWLHFNIHRFRLAASCCFLGAIMVSHRWNLNHLPQIVFENLSKEYGIYIKLKESSNLIRMRKENTFKRRENTCWKNKQRNPISVS